MSSNKSALEAALEEYLDECHEMLEMLTRDISAIEKSGGSPEAYASIYRNIHTIKGNSQLFGFKQIGLLAHAMETCLDLGRRDQLQITPAVVDVYYSGIDIISALLSGIRETGREPDKSRELDVVIPRLCEFSEAAVTHTQPLPKKVSMPTVHSAITDVPPTVNEIKITTPTEAAMAKKGVEPAESQGWGIFEDDDVIAPVQPKFTPVDQSESTKVEPARSLPIPEHGSINSTSNLSLSQKPEENHPKVANDDPHSETIRVQVTILDNLMNLVGELVLIRNQLLQESRLHDDDADFNQLGQRLNVLTAELQNEVMKTRMQPIGNILTKFKRVVRDLGRELGKNIDLELLGVETELDKTIIESVKDPLTHIVRNCIDHGLESATDRKRLGKPEIGHIKISAYHESGQVIIEIADDGRGLDRKLIGTRAVERQLITQETLKRMTDREVQALIFAPGFTTAASVSNISGRGVGMDVVKTNIERIGGIVDLISQPGIGTTIKLKIPLTLAIVPALIVKSQGQRFAIPQTKLIELLRIDSSAHTSDQIEILQGQPVYHLRGKILPLLCLYQILDQEKHGSNEQAIINHCLKNEIKNFAVLNADGLQFGLLVDEIEDSADIVVKSMPAFLKDISVFSGASIMGDGSVALTLDVAGLAHAAKFGHSQTSDLPTHIPTAIDAKIASHQLDTSEYLLVDVDQPGDYGIPLTIVSRLEEFDRSRIEYSGEQRIVRYRNSLLPIFSLPAFLNLSPVHPQPDTGEKVNVVVIKRGSRHYGIQVQGILDVILADGKVDSSVRDRDGILGSLIHQDRVIVIADVLGMIDVLTKPMQSALPQSEAATGSVSSEAKKYAAAMRRRHKILIVEDSSFFRNFMRQTLEESGFQCDLACDGADALTRLSSHPANYYSLVLSDIEMPILDGIALASKIRATEALSTIPLIAITTRFSVADIQRGLDAGFNGYLEKLNAEVLISELDSILIAGTPSQELKHGTSH